MCEVELDFLRTVSLGQEAGAAQKNRAEEGNVLLIPPEERGKVLPLTRHERSRGTKRSAVTWFFMYFIKMLFYDI